MRVPRADAFARERLRVDREDWRTCLACLNPTRSLSSRFGAYGWKRFMVERADIGPCVRKDATERVSEQPPMTVPSGTVSRLGASDAQRL